MLPPILTTKLYTPPPRPKVVLRPRLIERLNEGLQRTSGVTLISATAGSGKTTLVSEWVAHCERPVAWLSLDDGDNDPVRFLTYLVAALQTIAANIGSGVMTALHASRPQPPSSEWILTNLLNEMTAHLDHFILVLDDYHVIEAQPVDQALTFLVEHLPPQMHLVIASREDPPLPLARLRARGRLTELRAADLCFTSAEAAEFLNRVMSLNLSAEDIAALGKALVILQRIGFTVIQEEEQALTARTLRGLKQIPGITAYGITDPDSPHFAHKGGVIVFRVEGLMANRVATELAERGAIGVRSGCHCAHMLVKRLLHIPWLLEQFQGVILTLFPKLSLPGLTRVSLGLANSAEDIDTLIEVLDKIALQPKANAGNPSASTRTDIQKQVDDFIQAAAQKVYAPRNPPGDVDQDTSRN